MTKQITILYIPCPDEKSAAAIGFKLLENKSAACIQTFKAGSMYSWNGKIEQTKEVIMLVKTFDKSASKAISIIKKNHSYQVPCILQYKSKVNKEYFNWMKETMS